MSHKIFDNDLVAMRKNKVTLMLNKRAYIGMNKNEYGTTQGYYSETLIV